ncbi:MAG TPA: cyclic nucleotide-binding domain-containing protein [Acidimicrobiales bacterium]|jgi:CRP-like cAMP-binding protein
MARGNHYLDHLSGVSLFTACSKKELREVAKRAEDVEVRAGSVLCEEGKSGRQFFVIVSGSAKVTRKKRKVNELGPGDFFGELSLLDQAPRSATVTATSDMEVVVLERRAFNDLLNDVPTLAFKVAAGLSRRLREADSKALH